MSVATKKVLLVDDNEDSCTLFEMALNFAGLNVDCVFTGDEGLDRLLAGTYDVAVIDISLPGLNGYEVARRAKAALGERTPRLIALTGHGRASDREAAMQAGFAMHLLKPVDLDTLVDAVTG